MCPIRWKRLQDRKEKTYPKREPRITRRASAHERDRHIGHHDDCSCFSHGSCRPHKGVEVVQEKGTATKRAEKHGEIHQRLGQQRTNPVARAS